MVPPRHKPDSSGVGAGHLAGGERFGNYVKNRQRDIVKTVTMVMMIINKSS